MTLNNVVNFEINKHEYYFIYEKELRALLHKFKKKAYDYNGILYGDIVINSIIAKYYKDKFLEEKNDNLNFWKTEISPETAARTITSKNFDVYFKTFHDYMNFYNYIKKNYQIIENISFNSNIFLHNKYIINENIGKTITWQGVDINLNLNITTKMPHEKNIEPPFGLANFNSDLLVMTKDCNGPRFSKNTGIDNLDNMNIIDKNLIFAKLIKDICYFKIIIISKNELANNFIANKTIEYIENGWNIQNIPFKIEKYNSDNSTVCCICLEDINKNTDVSILTNTIGDNYLYIHTKCLFDYISNKIINNNELICPLRQKINFIKIKDDNDIIKMLKN